VLEVNKRYGSRSVDSKNWHKLKRFITEVIQSSQHSLHSNHIETLLDSFFGLLFRRVGTGAETSGAT
jgi:hypothetical protein